MSKTYKIWKQGVEVERIANNGPDFPIPAEEWDIIKSVWTMLSDPEKRILWHLAKTHVDGKGGIINLGHANGGSTHVMGLALLHFKKQGIIRSVDFFKTTTRDRARTMLDEYGLSQRVELHKGLTWELGDLWAKEEKYADVIFIDAGHDYESVRKDWLIFSQLIVNKNSVVAFHDTNQIHTDRVIQEYVDPKKWRQTYHVDRIKVFQWMQ